MAVARRSRKGPTSTRGGRLPDDRLARQRQSGSPHGRASAGHGETMSAEDPAADNSVAETDTEAEKTVTVIAYAEPGRFNDDREFAQALVPEVDWDEKTATTDSKTYLEFGDHRQQVSHDLRRALEEAFDDGIDMGDAKLVREETERTQYTNNPKWSVADHLLDGILDDLPESIGDLGLSYWNEQYIRDGECVINFRGNSLQPRKPLAHHSKRSPDDRFESEERVFSVQFRIQMGPATEDELDEWSNQVNAEVIDHLWNLEAIQKVRVADCETVKKGDCFNV